MAVKPAAARQRALSRLAQRPRATRRANEFSTPSMSKRHFLEFEQPIAELETKIEELRYVQNESAVDISGRDRPARQKEPCSSPKTSHSSSDAAGR